MVFAGCSWPHGHHHTCEGQKEDLCHVNEKMSCDAEHCDYTDAVNSHDHSHVPANQNFTPMQAELNTAMDTMHQDMNARMAYEDADLAFAVGMIPHHQGAVEMAKIQLKYGKDPELQELSQAIIEAQEKEIAFLKAWVEKHDTQE